MCLVLSDRNPGTRLTRCFRPIVFRTLQFKYGREIANEKEACQNEKG
jgi:hypothetical protein